MYDVERVIDCQHELGEGPVWHGDEGALYWVDIKGRSVERYVPDTGHRRSVRFNTAVTALGLRAANGFIVATADGFALWDGQSAALDFIANPERGRQGIRFNDGAVGPGGEYWAGTMYEGPEVADTPDGRLYRLDAQQRVTEMERGLTISNGIGWSPDAHTMYLTDTLRGIIYAYDYDAETGRIENRRVLVQVPEGDGFPDGLTVDSEGCIWSARWGGGKVAKYSPSAEPLEELSLPVPQPTSCAFGGEGLDQLYITSAWVGLHDAQRAEYPLSGDTFSVDVEVRGLPAYEFNG